MSANCCLLKMKNGYSSKKIYKNEQKVTDWEDILRKCKLAEEHISRTQKYLLSYSNKNTQIKTFE